MCTPRVSEVNRCAVSACGLALALLPWQANVERALHVTATAANVAYCDDFTGPRLVADLQVTLRNVGHEQMGIVVGHQFVSHFVGRYQRADGEPGYLEAGYTRWSIPDDAFVSKPADILVLGGERGHTLVVPVSIHVSRTHDPYRVPGGVTLHGVWEIGLFDHGPRDLARLRRQFPTIRVLAEVVKTPPVDIAVAIPRVLPPCPDPPPK